MKLVPLSQSLTALVDDEDYERLAVHRWHVNIVNGNPYARRNDGVYMHRFVMNAGPEDYVDHKFGSTLDNQKFNLRLCTNAENCRSFKRKKPGTTSRFIGVSWFKRDECWRAYVVFGGIQKHLGYFTEEEAAARAYDGAARVAFGNFAPQNFR